MRSIPSSIPSYVMPGFLTAVASAKAVSRTVVIALLAAPLQAQTLEFEVATIKPNKSGSPRSGTYTPSLGRFEGTNVTLRQLMMTAYDVRSIQIVGGPDWLTSERFDVIGKPADTTPPHTIPEMLRHLLAERFKLVVHKEMRDQPVYALVLARADRKLGPALKVSECSGDDCGNMSTNESNGSGTVKGISRTMQDLAGWIADRVDRDVMDRTGATDNYDFDLKYTSVRVGASPPPADAPSLFTGLQEQLGLKLEGARGPVEFIVIDRAEPPTPD